MSSTNKEWQPLGDGSLPSEDPSVGLGHIVPLKVYTGVWLLLLALTALTVYIATCDFKVANLAIALIIATVKAGFVTLFFMHLKYENKMTWIIAIYPIFIFILILGGTLGDISVIDNTLPSGQVEAPKTLFDSSAKDNSHSEHSVGY